MPARQSGGPGTPTVLIAEDYPDFRARLLALLEPLALNCVPVANGRQAIEVLRAVSSRGGGVSLLFRRSTGAVLFGFNAGGLEVGLLLEALEERGVVRTLAERVRIVGEEIYDEQGVDAKEWITRTMIKKASTTCGSKCALASDKMCSRTFPSGHAAR